MQIVNTRAAFERIINDTNAIVESVVFVPAARDHIIKFFLSHGVHVLTEGMSFFPAY